MIIMMNTLCATITAKATDQCYAIVDSKNVSSARESTVCSANQL
jgi:hypothetical protein